MTRTYGTIEISGRNVVIDCEPHVRMLIKRVVNGVRQPQGKLVLHATLTDSLAKDLQWIQQRYPLQQKTMTHQAVRAAAIRYDTVRDRAARIIARGVGKTPPLALPLRDYQSVAAELAYVTRGLLLADELGVGKTAPGIGLIAHKDTRPALVVVPTHLQGQWLRELGRFAPTISGEKVKTLAPHDITSDVIVITYSKLHRWADVLAGAVRTVIFDEVQELRSGPGTDGKPILKYHAAKQIAAHADWRLGLSATPIHNYGFEFFNVVSLLSPDLLGTEEEFKAEWCHNTGHWQLRDADAFGSFLRDRGVMLRRTRVDVKREIPALTRATHEIEIDLSRQLETSAEAAEATELARKLIEMRRRDIDDATIEIHRGEGLTMGGRLAAILRHATGVAKAIEVARFVDMVVETSGPVILAGWHHDVYEIWEKVLAHLKPVFFTGAEGEAAKRKAVDAFVRGDSKVFVMSLRSGAGIDGLQYVCSNMVIGELDWSPSVHEQIEGRIHRDGQANPVFVYYMVGTDGADPTIVEALGVKRGQLRGVIGEPSDKGKRDASRSQRLAEDWLRRKGLMR